VLIKILQMKNIFIKLKIQTLQRNLQNFLNYFTPTRYLICKLIPRHKLENDGLPLLVKIVGGGAISAEVKVEIVHSIR